MSAMPLPDKGNIKWKRSARSVHLKCYKPFSFIFKIIFFKKSCPLINVHIGQRQSLSLNSCHKIKSDIVRPDQSFFDHIVSAFTRFTFQFLMELLNRYEFWQRNYSDKVFCYGHSSTVMLKLCCIMNTLTIVNKCILCKGAANAGCTGTLNLFYL